MPTAGTRATAGAVNPTGVLVLDVVYIAATLALFAIVALIAKGVEKLGPRPGGSPRHEMTERGGRG